MFAAWIYRKKRCAKAAIWIDRGQGRRYPVIYEFGLVLMDRIIIVASRAAREVRVRLLALSVAIPGLVLAPQKSGG